jgi:hypothetical protein
MVGWFVSLHSPLKLQDSYSIMPAEEYDCCIIIERVPTCKSGEQDGGVCDSTQCSGFSYLTRSQRE